MDLHEIRDWLDRAEHALAGLPRQRCEPIDQFLRALLRELMALTDRAERAEAASARAVGAAAGCASLAELARHDAGGCWLPQRGLPPDWGGRAP